VRACASDAALAAVLALYETALGMPAADALALMRRAGSMEEVRDGLGIGFAAFNHALVALGPPYAPLTHPNLHEAAVARYVAEHGDRMLERLRERYRPLAQQGQDISEHGRTRRFDDLADDPAWLLTCRTPDDERLAQAGRAWLAGHGAGTDLAAPPVLPPVEPMRSRAAQRLYALVDRAAPLLRAWCRKHGATVPQAWATPHLEAQFALEQSGVADLIDPPDQWLLETAAEGAGWPDGMPLAADAEPLGLTAQELAAAAAGQGGGKPAKPAPTS